MTYPPEQLLFLNENDVLSLLTPTDVIALAEDTFYHIGTGEITVGQMGLMYADPEQKNNFHSMPAILRHRGYAGVKWIDTYAAPLPGYPFSHGNLVILSDTRTGCPCRSHQHHQHAHRRRPRCGAGQTPGQSGA